MTMPWSSLHFCTGQYNTHLQALVREHRCLCYGWGTCFWRVDGWESIDQEKDLGPVFRSVVFFSFVGIYISFGYCMQLSGHNVEIIVFLLLIGTGAVPDGVVTELKTIPQIRSTQTAKIKQAQHWSTKFTYQLYLSGNFFSTFQHFNSGRCIEE